jgi:cellulose synthase/poly-beta-1,6-N-acetylglucosamine synthase-like glycosyltransferase
LNSPDLKTQTETTLSSAEWIDNPEILPKVSIVIPTYNESQYIKKCIDAILMQDYPIESLEILVVDGNSEDNTLDLVHQHFIDQKMPVAIHKNPKRKTPTGLNIGVCKSTGDVVIILGAHAELYPGFIRRNVENLRIPGVVCSGGTQINLGDSPKQISIGVVMSHWFGMATAPHRYQKKPGKVHTVAYGAYRRDLFKEIGYFEEEGSIAEDAELNWRIIQSGYDIYFDPDIKARYYPRNTFIKFAYQMYRYGILRAYMFRKHFEGLAFLHFIPPAFLLTLVGLVAGSVFHRVPQILLAILLLIYGGLVTIFGFLAWRGEKRARPMSISWAFVSMHLAWALGFIIGVISRKTFFKEFVISSRNHERSP